MKKTMLNCKRILCVILAMLMAVSLLPMAALAADVQYLIGFTDQDGNRIYGSVSIQNAYDGTRYFSTSSSKPYITFTATSSRYYNVTFQNDDGYYRFYTFLATSDDTQKDKSAVSCMALRVPYTVTVRYSDGTLATGVKVRANYEVGEQTTNGSGQCTVYGAVNRDVTVEAFDGQNWVGKVIRPATPGPKTLELTIEKRVAVPIKVLLGGQEFNGFTVTASNAEETVSGNPPYLKPSKTYTLEIAHHEQGDNILEYQLENGIQPITATYTVPKNPTVQTFNATLKAPVPYYFGYVDGNPQFIYLESGKTYTVSPEQSLSFLIKNRIKGATYTITSSNPAAVQTSGLSYTAVAAGEATLTLTVAYGNASETFRFTVKVSRTQVAVPAADPTVYTYDGTEQTYQLPANSAYTVSNATRTEAGSQQVTVALKDTARTEWADGTTADKYYEFTIQKAKTVAKHPAGLTLNYNGAPQPLVAGGETVNGLSFRFEYALGADSTTAPATGWSTDLPTAVDAGDYYVWYRLIADSNHESLAPACTVAKLLPVSPTADLFYFTPPQALTYDGTPKLADVTPAPSVRGMGSVTVRYYEENGQPVESPVDAGNYRVELELESGTNYTAATLQNANWSFTVKPRTLEIQWGETAFVYDGSEHFPDFLVHNVIDTDDIILETSGKAINASDTPYTAKIIGISGADSANYSLPANCEIDFTVARIVPDVGTVTVAAAVTDRTLPAQVQLTHSGTALGTLTLLNPAVSPSKSDYRWQFTPADTTNYETVYGDILLDVLDTRPPALTLHAAEQDWTQIQEKFTFDRLLNTPQTVTLTAADEADGSGLKAVEYLITDQPLDLEARSAAQWQPYTEAIRLTADGRYIVYARAIDNDGNLTLASTDGLVIDTVAPLFQGIADGETYVGDRQFKVVDQGAVRLTVDGADVTDQLTDGEFTLPADDQQHLLIATDEAGNSTECRITVNRQKQNPSAGGNGGSQSAPPENNSPQKPAKPSKPAAPQGGNQAPATGDDSNWFQWIALAFISGGLLAGTLLFKKRILK